MRPRRSRSPGRYPARGHWPPGSEARAAKEPAPLAVQHSVQTQQPPATPEERDDDQGDRH
jgi:hypothetical protein